MKPETALGYVGIILAVVLFPPLIVPVALALLSGETTSDTQ